MNDTNMKITRRYRDLTMLCRLLACPNRRDQARRCCMEWSCVSKGYTHQCIMSGDIIKTSYYYYYYQFIFCALSFFGSAVPVGSQKLEILQ